MLKTNVKYCLLKIIQYSIVEIFLERYTYESKSLTKNLQEFSNKMIGFLN